MVIQSYTKTIKTMKLKLFLIAAFVMFSLAAQSQSCDIQIQILENKYMFGQAEKIDNSEKIKKMEVTFNSEFMEVVMPVDNQNYLVKVVNQDCQAYCSRAKRVRQLHSGDEKLVRNLFKDKYDDIVAQIQECGESKQTN